MRIKLDENLPSTLAALLAELGHDSDTVPGEGLAGQCDRVVWEAAQESERFLITQDLDFADLRRYVASGHHGVLVLRLHRPTRSQIIARVRTLFESSDVSSWAGSFVLATETKIRIRR